MVLHTPTILTDFEMLKEKGLLDTAFWEAQSEGDIVGMPLKQKNCEKLAKKIAKKKNRGAIRAWLSMALADHKEDRTPELPKLEPERVQLFVDFFWAMYLKCQGKTSGASRKEAVYSALEVLNAYRKDHNLGFIVSSSVMWRKRQVKEDSEEMETSLPNSAPLSGRKRAASPSVDVEAVAKKARKELTRKNNAVAPPTSPDRHSTASSSGIHKRRHTPEAVGGTPSKRPKVNGQLPPTQTPLSEPLVIRISIKRKEVLPPSQAVASSTLPAIPSSSVHSARQSTSSRLVTPISCIPSTRPGRKTAQQKPKGSIEIGISGITEAATPLLTVKKFTPNASSLALMRLQSDCPNPAVDRKVYPSYPPIWAASRQEVCEAFPRFRSYQGGVYYTSNKVPGYFLSEHSSLRDGWFQNGKIIISHGGGKAESTMSSKGKLKKKAASDQGEADVSVRALLNTYRMKEPVVLLVDDKYRHFPYGLKEKGYTYVILGFYFISHVWNELQPAENADGYVVRYKFAFQWCANQREPWWIKDDQWQFPDAEPVQSFRQVRLNAKRRYPVGKVRETLMILNDTTSLVFPTTDSKLAQQCDACGNESPKVYQYSWMCLRSSCKKFWQTDVEGPLPAKLKFYRKFLELFDDTQRVHLDRFMREDIFPLTEVPVPKEDTGQEVIATDYVFSRGWHCKKCGRLSCRFRWSRWECMGCGANYKIPMMIQKTGPQAKDVDFVRAKAGIDHYACREISLLPNLQGSCETWVLPDGVGKIHRIRVRDSSDADSIFTAYQEQAKDGELDFRRWPMRRHKCRGSLLTHYFSHNCGEPYDYVGGADNTVSWDKAPSAVVRARDLIQSRVETALRHVKDYQFNEVLSAAYMQNQSMAFHSDAENGLDSIVAGLSMGSSAKMHFRQVKRTVKFAEGEKQHIVLTVILHHGDVLVMDGAAIQERYEHTVIPYGFRIAATARKIDAKAPKTKQAKSEQTCEDHQT